MTAPLFLHSSPVDAESTRRSAASCHKAAPLPSCGAGEREEAAKRLLKRAQGKRAGDWPRPNDSSLLAPLFPACFPHTRRRQRLALEDNCVRSLFYVPPAAQAERLSKEGRTEEKKEWPIGPPGGHFFRPCPPQCPSAVAVSQRLYCAS